MSRPRRIYTRRLVPVLRLVDVDMVARATLNGAGVDARLVDAISDIEFDLTMDGASQLTLSVEDPGQEILRSDLLAGQIDLALPRAGRWRMDRPSDVGGLSINGTTTQLRLWDLGPAALQQHNDPLRKLASKLDLRGFVALLAREIRSQVDLDIVVPDPGEVPHIEQETSSDRIDRGTSSGTSGWSPRAAPEVRVKGQPATREQLRVMDAVFTEALRHRPSALAFVTLAAAITVESEYRNVQGSGADSISFGVLQNIPGTSAGVNGTMTRAQAMDIAYSVKSALLHPGPTSQGGLIQAAREHPTWRPGQLADLTINGVGVGDPGYVTKVDIAAVEAHRNIELWTGSDLTSSDTSAVDGRSSEVVYLPAEWRRGTSSGLEGGWKTLKRYADQLGRRRFVAGPTTRRPRLVMARDQQLILATPHLSIAFDDDDILLEQPQIDLEGRERLEQIELKVLRSAWSAPPGAVVDVTRAGLADGPWLVLSARTRSGDPTAAIVLTQPTTRRQPDPALSTAQRRPVDPAAASAGAAAAIAWADAHVGVREVGVNSGPGVEAIVAAVGGTPGKPWCGYFCGAALAAAGLAVPSSIGSVKWIYDSAAARRAPFRGATDPRGGAVGDLAVIGGPSEHVELIVRVDITNRILHTIGGNTSLPDGGQGVARKQRSFASCVRVAQVAYGA